MEITIHIPNLILLKVEKVYKVHGYMKDGKAIICVQYKPLYASNDLFETWETHVNQGPNVALEILNSVIKQVAKQDPQMAWLDKAVEDAVLGTK